MEVLSNGKAFLSVWIEYENDIPYLMGIGYSEDQNELMILAGGLTGRRDGDFVLTSLQSSRILNYKNRFAIRGKFERYLDPNLKYVTYV